MTKLQLDGFIAQFEMMINEIKGLKASDRLRELENKADLLHVCDVLLYKVNINLESLYQSRDIMSYRLLKPEYFSDKASDFQDELSQIRKRILEEWKTSRFSIAKTKADHYLSERPELTWNQVAKRICYHLYIYKFKVLSDVHKPDAAVNKFQVKADEIIGSLWFGKKDYSDDEQVVTNGLISYFYLLEVYRFAGRTFHTSSLIQSNEQQLSLQRELLSNESKKSLSQVPASSNNNASGVTFEIVRPDEGSHSDVRNYPSHSKDSREGEGNLVLRHSETALNSSMATFGASASRSKAKKKSSSLLRFRRN